MALNYLYGEGFCKYSSCSSEHDVLIKNILIMHNPDGRELDSEMLLRVIETIMHRATASQAFVQQQDPLDMNTVVEEAQDLLENSICNISNEILCKCYGDENVHERTLNVLNLLESYRWDAKLLLALSALATVFGEFWIIMQSQNKNPLAASIALLRHFPESNIFNPIFIALTTLVKTMVEVIRCVSQFEGLPITHVEIQGDSVTMTKSLIYVAAYWITRSIIVSISIVINLRAIEDDQVHPLSFQDPYSISSAVWEIASLRSKINGIGSQLGTLVDACQQQTEQKMHRKLMNVLQEPNINNQNILWMLFGLRNDLPLKQSTMQAKVGITSLKDKVVVLLISKPELLPVDELFLLIQQTYDHPLHNKQDRSYDILWIPISTSENWSNSEVSIFHLLSNSLPWYSIRQPWLLSPATIYYAKQEWKFDGHPIMITLDPTGTITNIYAADMVWIWGAKAYPFSASREIELWRTEKWNLRLLLDSIYPLFTMWAEKGRTICIYGSSKLEWVRQFSAEIKEIQSLAAQLEVIYVGKTDQSVLVSNIVSSIEKEKLSHSLTLSKISLFWRRLESIRRSKLRLQHTTDTDHILREVVELLDTCKEDNDEDWMIFQRGSSTDIVKLHGNEWSQFFSKFSTWKKYLPEIGLVDAIKISQEPPPTEPCSHSSPIRYKSYKKELMEETVICEKCKRPMEKLIIYDVV